MTSRLRPLSLSSDLIASPSFSRPSTTMAARAVLASSLRRLSSPTPSAKLIPRRGLAGGGDHHGPPKVNIWEDPLSPSKWKEEHFVLASLGGWFLLGYGGYKLFGGKKEKKEEVVAASAH
ncbi:uncharacterized protein [Elaeis guineensis]|uniref:Uncharacterized protein LOC105032743 n=1 Tax=Elaeis guineensis var. tenera TaxID=51953 RepID=A0A6I9QA77_ELAGV|nr:uncharacterized protein LOC105032743 [Elaeis guineensis]